MPIDEKEFFREATLRICGSLEIEKALGGAFMYLRDYIPTDGLVLGYHDPEMGSNNVVAFANSEGGLRRNIRIPMSPEQRSFVGSPQFPEVMIVNRPDDFPPVRHMIQYFDRLDSSVMLMRLRVEGNLIGALVFLVKGHGRYSEEHVRLILLLREPFAIALSNSLRYEEVLRLKNLLAEDNVFLRDELRQNSGEEIIGADFGLRGVMEMVYQVAPLGSPVLLLGETGTGKEVMATAVHNLSPRKEGPFIKVNCGAIPESLVDSELFGHEKGAFTGALALKRGRFERADGGSIFLDEIGELPPEAQVRLLRVLQEKEVERVGGTEPIKVDIRVIAATNQDLERMVQRGQFRQDLFFRLQVFPILIPPLRKRIQDLPTLIHHFIQKKSREMGRKSIPEMAPGAIDLLMGYSWPGNVRELENAVERALILSKGGTLTFDTLLTSWGLDFLPPEAAWQESIKLDSVLSLHIRRILERTEGKVHGEDGAAALLGMNPSTLRSRMRKLGIPFGRKAKGPG
jgi:transcriptional regulator with GAF, ATPase, and Fis domain